MIEMVRCCVLVVVVRHETTLNDIKRHKTSQTSCKRHGQTWTDLVRLGQTWTAKDSHKAYKSQTIYNRGIKT